MGHLPEDATLSGYNGVIAAILNEPKNLVYHYPYGVRDYYAVSGKVGTLDWLVIFAGDAILETTFPPENLEDYLANRGFVLLGSVEEFLSE